MSGDRPAATASSLLFFLFLLVVVSGCRQAPPTAEDSRSSATSATTGVPTTAGAGEVTIDPLPRVQVTVYYPAASGNGLVGERHEIFETATPGDRAKQILSDLISGPLSKNALSPMPSGTQLRQVFIIEDQRVAYVDLSSELKQGMGGGSLEERLTVYSIVNSVALNIPQVQRVTILIDGEPTDTLNGHMDLTRPLAPDRSLIVGADSARLVMSSFAAA